MFLIGLKNCIVCRLCQKIVVIQTTHPNNFHKKNNRWYWLNLYLAHLLTKMKQHYKLTVTMIGKAITITMQTTF